MAVTTSLLIFSFAILAMYVGFKTNEGDFAILCGVLMLGLLGIITELQLITDIIYLGLYAGSFIVGSIVVYALYSGRQSDGGEV